MKYLGKSSCLSWSFYISGKSYRALIGAKRFVDGETFGVMEFVIRESYDSKHGMFIWRLSIDADNRIYVFTLVYKN